MQRSSKPITFVIFITIIVFVLVTYRNDINLDTIKRIINQFGIWAPIIFILLYALATIFFLPGLIFTIAGGIIFGPMFGVLYNILGATLGATCAFIIARYFAGDWIKQKTGKRLTPLMRGIHDEDWRFVAFVRLVPFVPFSLLNYALGLTQIRLWSYIIASFIFMLPGCFAYTYLGHAGAAFTTGQEGYIRMILIGVGLLAAMVFLPYFVRSVHKRMQNKRTQNK